MYRLEACFLKSVPKLVPILTYEGKALSLSFQFPEL